MTEAVLAALHELIDVTRGSRDDGCMRLGALAEFLDMSKDHVEKRIITRPDFPRPVRLNGVGHPRWLRSDVRAWVRSQQT